MQEIMMFALNHNLTYRKNYDSKSVEIEGENRTLKVSTFGDGYYMVTHNGAILGTGKSVESVLPIIEKMI